MNARRWWALPLVPLYATALAVKDGLQRAGVLRTRKLQWPVVSVGSLSAGGAGKTPVVIALAELLSARGWHVDVLSRGYGREGRGVERVDPEVADAAQRFGDEPVLLARRLHVPVWVGADRFAAGTAAEAASETKARGVHLLDDGFQHWQLARAVDIVLVTAGDLEDALLPAGNRRERLAALRRADVVVLREEERERVLPRLSGLLRPDTALWTVRRTVEFPVEVDALHRNDGLIAFCAIARPESFVAMLGAEGARVVDSVIFPDHHQYTDEDIRKLTDSLQRSGGDAFITTEKDAVKITPELRAQLEATAPLLVAQLHVVFPDEAEVVREFRGANPVRVLIVRIGAMGDVLHAMPAVAALRAAHPDWMIGWAIEPRWSDLLQITGDAEDLLQGVGPMARGMVDRWYRVPASEWRRHPFSHETGPEIFALRRALRDAQYDVCVDMQGAIKSAVVGKMAGARLFTGPAKPRERIARWLYTDRVNVTATHVVEQGCELLGAAVGETLRPARVTLPMDAEDEHWADGVVGHERFCLISPGGGWGSKVWPARRLGRVAAELGRAGVRSVVNATVPGSDEADEVVATSDGFARAVPCSIGQLIALTRRAAVVIAGDTGPLHLAAALERPVVGIYGPTDPARNGPYGTRSRVLRDASSVTSHKRSRETESGMLVIEVDAVAQAALEMLG